jgi:2-oxoglutarate ferredoxin oxidoreductase subunit delta
MTDVAETKKGKGTVVVRSEICKGCSFCVDFCPSKCLGFSKGFNAKGYHYPVLATPEACTGCDMCGLYCPDFAIFGVRYKDLEKKQAATTGT